MFGDRMQIENMDINRINAYRDRPDCLLLDIREAEAYQKGHLPGAISVSFEALMMEEYVPDEKKKIFVYCDSGQHSYEVCQMLVEKGYEAVNLLGGYPAYRQRGQESGR